MRTHPSTTRKLTPVVLVMLFGVGGLSAAAPRTVTFEERVAAQRAIEQVYWSHRTWPADNPGPKPLLSAVLSDDALRAKIEHAVNETRSTTPAQLNQEVARMAAHSRAPEILRELFEALANDPLLIAETLGRESLADRSHGEASSDVIDAAASGLPEITASATCANDAWRAIQGTPESRYLHTAVWTGSEMLIWGGRVSTNPYITVGGRYNPATDTWIRMSTINQPATRVFHTAVWTGTRMIV